MVFYRPDMLHCEQWSWRAWWEKKVVGPTTEVPVVLEGVTCTHVTTAAWMFSATFMISTQSMHALVVSGA